MSSVTEAVPISAGRTKLGRLEVARLLQRASSIAICVLAWHLASTRQVDLGVVTFQNVPSPREVVAAAWGLVESGTLLPHLTASISRVFSGFLMAAAA